MIIWALLVRRWHHWRLYRDTVNELSNLDDRTLNDLNIRRSDIHFVARNAANAQTA